MGVFLAISRMYAKKSIYLPVEELAAMTDSSITLVKGNEDTLCNIEKEELGYLDSATVELYKFFYYNDTISDPVASPYIGMVGYLRNQMNDIKINRELNHVEPDTVKDYLNYIQEFLKNRYSEIRRLYPKTAQAH